jgi:hypothetical protein
MRLPRSQWIARQSAGRLRFIRQQRSKRKRSQPNSTVGKKMPPRARAQQLLGDLPAGRSLVLYI